MFQQRKINALLGTPVGAGSEYVGALSKGQYKQMLTGAAIGAGSQIISGGLAGGAKVPTTAGLTDEQKYPNAMGTFSLPKTTNPY